MNRYKGLLTGFAVVAILALAYFSFVYTPPSRDDVKGTIGAAERYRGDQIDQADVRLSGQDEVGSEVATEFLTVKESDELVGRMDADTWGRADPAVVSRINPETIGRLTPEQVGRITPDQLVAFLHGKYFLLLHLDEGSDEPIVVRVIAGERVLFEKTVDPDDIAGEM